MASRTPFNSALSVVLGAFFIGSSLLANPSPELRQRIRDAARRASLDPKLVEAVIKIESRFKANATSPKGAQGLMQVMKRTADECGIHNAYHVIDNLMGASDCLRRLINYYRGDLKRALAAYNAGSRNVDRYGGIPPFPETQNYVVRVLAEYQRLQRFGK